MQISAKQRIELCGNALYKNLLLLVVVVVVVAVLVLVLLLLLKQLITPIYGIFGNVCQFEEIQVQPRDHWVLVIIKLI